MSTFTGHCSATRLAKQNPHYLFTVSLLRLTNVSIAKNWTLSDKPKHVQQTDFNQ